MKTGVDYGVGPLFLGNYLYVPDLCTFRTVLQGVVPCRRGLNSLLHPTGLHLHRWKHRQLNYVDTRTQ